MSSLGTYVNFSAFINVLFASSMVVNRSVLGVCYQITLIRMLRVMLQIYLVKKASLIALI